MTQKSIYDGNYIELINLHSRVFADNIKLSILDFLCFPQKAQKPLVFNALNKYDRICYLNVSVECRALYAAMQ